MLLRDKISSDLNKVIDFLKNHLITDGEENDPDTLMIAIRPVSRFFPGISYSYSLPSLEKDDQTDEMIDAVLRTIQRTTLLTIHEKFFTVDYQISFRNGSRRVINPLQEIQKIAQLKEKLQQSIHDEVTKAVSYLRSVNDPEKALKIYRWQIVLETLNLFQTKQRFLFNYHWSDFFSLGQYSLAHDKQSDYFTIHVLNQIKMFLEALEIRDSSLFTLQFHVQKTEKWGVLQRDVSEDLSLVAVADDVSVANSYDLKRIHLASTVQGIIDEDNSQDVNLSSIAACSMRQEYSESHRSITLSAHCFFNSEERCIRLDMQQKSQVLNEPLCTAIDFLLKHQ